MRVPLPRNPEMAFTLLELIVAIAIAALVISLGGVALQKVQVQGQQAKCLANMRQVGSYILHYTSEYNGNLLPALHRTNPDSGSGPAWHQILNNKGILLYENWHQRPNSIMSCPSGRPLPRPSSHPYKNDWASREFNGVHFAMNAYPGFSNMIGVGQPENKLARIQNPSQTMLLTESKWVYQIQSNTASGRIEPHQGGVNIWYADGHAAHYKEALPIYPSPKADTLHQEPFF